MSDYYGADPRGAGHGPAGYQSGHVPGAGGGYYGEVSQRPAGAEGQARGGWDQAGTMGGRKLAPAYERIVSGAIDYVPGFFLYGIPAGVGSSIDQGVGQQSTFFGGTGALIGIVLALGFTLANSAVMQGLTGRSLGKRLLGLQLTYPVRERGVATSDYVAAYPGVGRCLVRVLINLVIGVGLAGCALAGPVILALFLFTDRQYRRGLADRAVGTIVLARGYNLQLEKATGDSVMKRRR